MLKIYLTIGLWAWDFYEVIVNVDEAEDRINYYLIEIKG